MKVDWVAVGGKPPDGLKPGEVAHCERCGQGLRLGSLPIPVFAAACKAFVKMHSKCKPGACAEPTATTPEEWFGGRDTGTSSLTIFHVMTGYPSPHGCYDIPDDPDDFGRCYRLLELFPAWRERLPDVALRFPAWKPFVDNWDALTALYEQEAPTGMAPKLYEEMQRLAEAADEGVGDSSIQR